MRRLQIERQTKRNVSCTRLPRQAKVIAEEMGISDFNGSDKGIQVFIKRNKLGPTLRHSRVLHQDKWTVEERVKIAKLQLGNVSLASKCISADQIYTYNMNKVPCNVGMMSNRRMTSKGEGNILLFDFVNDF